MCVRVCFVSLRLKTKRATTTSGKNTTYKRMFVRVECVYTDIYNRAEGDLNNKNTRKTIEESQNANYHRFIASQLFLVFFCLSIRNFFSLIFRFLRSDKEKREKKRG